MSEMINAQAAAAIAGVRSVTVYAWLKNGKLKGEKIGRSIMIKQADVEAISRGGKVREPELERARAIVEGDVESDIESDIEDEDQEDLDGDEESIPDHLEGLDAEQRSDFKVRMAKRLVGQAVVLRNRRQREAERELLWLAVQELGLSDSEEAPVKRRGGDDDMPF